MSGMQHEMDLSGVTPFPEWDFTSMTESDDPYADRNHMTTWERGLLLLVVDWYSGGPPVGSQDPVELASVKDRPSVLSVFSEWAAFLHGQSNGLGPSKILAKKEEYSSLRVSKCWQKITTINHRELAIAALIHKILPLKEELETQFGVKICYVKHDKLPGCLSQDNTSHANDGTWGQYKVQFLPLPRTCPAAERVWKSLDEKRKEREKTYDLAMRQTNHVVGLDLPVVDLWDPDLQKVFGAMRR
ncbi:hypothetical protein BGAL_0095g00140 [Botrytis galanthina]|uniref:Uncharacterized protein n=1 Tax=Botrytis galanthina TaxID=278940 RepID=A0A4S8R2A9_9HELO|nr:hypothetical protein BGAL_0095g00140 [Botrytis galanthina]